MRPWLPLLLLLSLPVSDPGPLTDGDRVLENYSLTPRGPEGLQARTERRCVRMQSVHAAVLQRTAPFYKVHHARGRSSSPVEPAGIIHRNPELVLVVLHGNKERVPAFLRVRSGITQTEADGESIVKIKGHAAPPRFLLQRQGASGYKRAVATIHRVRAAVSSRRRAATAVTEPRRFTEAEKRPAVKIKRAFKQQMERPRRRESPRRAAGIKAVATRPSKASVRRHVLRAAALNSAETAEIQRNAVRMKTREKMESRNRRRGTTKAARDGDDKEDFIKQGRPEGGSGRRRLKTVEKQRPAHTRQAHKAQKHDADPKEALTEADALIMLFFPHGEESSEGVLSAGKISLKAPGDPSPAREDVAFEPENSKCKERRCNAPRRREGAEVKPAQRNKDTTQTTEHANDRENMINHAEPEPATPSANTTTAANIQREEETSRPGSAGEAPKTSPGSEPEREEGFSGLRMREDPRKESEERAAGGTARRDDPETSPQTNHRRDPEPPPCGGLIHRSEAGRKHCAERSAGYKTPPSKDPAGAFKDTRGEDGGNLLNGDEFDHFYHFDGRLRRVQRNLRETKTEPRRDGEEISSAASHDFL